MTPARLIIVIVGILLPYGARIPGGSAWLAQYTATGLGGFLFIEAFNSLAWGSLVALSLLVRRPAMLLIPGVLGFGYLGWAHAALDLAADAQAAIALVFIPVQSLLPIALGGGLACLLDRRLAGTRGRRDSPPRYPQQWLRKRRRPV